MTNIEIANIFYQIADALEIQEANPFRVNAYRRTAQIIEDLPQDIKNIYQEKKLEDLPGVGKDLATKITELIKTGKCKECQKILKKIPPGLLEIMAIEGMGPKTTRLVWKKFGVKSVKDLEYLIKKHKLQRLKGFKAKTEQNILRGIKLYRKYGERILLGVAYPQAESIVKQLKASKLANQVEIAGSLRRMKETIGDIDILVTTDKPKKIIDLFCSLPEVKEVIAKGRAKSTVILKTGLETDLEVVAPKSFGAALYYFTGSKEHNIHVRKLAMERGLKINEYGVFKGKKMIAGKTELEIFKSVGLPYMSPEIREDRGEIEAGLKNDLPKLIKLKDIKGDLHLHSKWSDGQETIEKIAQAAKKLAYQYIAICDHASAMGIVKGIKENNFKKYLNDIKKTNKKVRGIKILAGVEVDIEKDGKCYLPDELLKQLDIVVGAIHSNFKQDKKTMTRRLITAIKNPHIDIIAHPTNRLLNKREGVALDMEAVMKAARQSKTVLELNAHLARLDLSDIYCRMAKDFGIKVAIATDAHSTSEMKLMKYGLATARRGWLEKKDIINTRNFEKFKKFLDL